MSKTLPIDCGYALPLPPIKPEPGHGSCSVCGSPALRLHCVDCKTTFYCSLACQRVDFIGHQRTCEGLRNAPTQPLATATSSLKHEPDQPDQPDRPDQPNQLDHHGQDSLHPAVLPPGFEPSDPQSERERAAIRTLLDVPAVEIPVWDRQREPIALNKKLMPHQHVGLTWLLNQEKSPIKGGILADDMGLGKTIQALALILCHPPQDGTRKTTLIVVPTSLLRQWEREIDDKVKPGHKLKTVIFHSTKKKNMTVAKLLSYDIVLTTYGTLGFEWKQVYDNRKPDAAVLLASHAIFHRVILDEAHNIKNRNSQASKAVDRLRTTYRLCMTGTPLMNRLDEPYPLVRFLRVEPYRDLARFKGIANGGAMKKLHVLLGRILLRRTEKTIVDGEPILSLPELTIHTVEVVFDQDQQDFYRALEERSQLRMNRFLKDGTVLRNYWYILLLILRLRQCCCHPYLIKDHGIPEGVDMTPDDMVKLARKLTRPVVDRVKRQKIFECPMCHENTESPIIIYPCGHYVCGDCITNMVSVREPGWMEAEDDEDGTPMGHCPAEGCTKSVDSKHVICHRYFSEVHMSSGDEAYRSADTSDEEGLDEDDADDKGNLKDFIVSDDHDSSDSEDYDDTPRSASDSNSKKPLDSARPSTNSNADDSDDSDDSLPPIDSYFAHIKKKTDPSQDVGRNKSDSNEHHLSEKQMKDMTNRSRKSEHDIASEDSGASSGQKRKVSPGKGIAKPRKKLKKGKKKRTELTLSALRKSGSNSAAAKEQYFKRLRKDWETSAKIDKAMELLGMIRRDFPDEKTLVFSQFTSFLDLMEIPISDDGYNYRRYDGSMSNMDREAAVDDFMGKKEVKVMLVSLRCGNAGLNLYAATRVIMLDPFWNPSVEDQAIKRAHRMGQNNPVIAYRLLVNETVEDRIIALQESKRQLVSDVLNPEARKGVSRLSVREIAGLFGINWTG
ncbi:hypothetical protein F4679DRAFT_542508 [Xylaria curta]|nr:hypothetical protein F4679DRAFT_542508 [Xylaria curta]